jgi:hypothetical protein
MFMGKSYPQQVCASLLITLLIVLHAVDSTAFSCRDEKSANAVQFDSPYFPYFPLWRESNPAPLV